MHWTGIGWRDKVTGKISEDLLFFGYPFGQLHISRTEDEMMLLMSFRIFAKMAKRCSILSYNNK